MGMRINAWESTWYRREAIFFVGFCWQVCRSLSYKPSLGTKLIGGCRQFGITRGNLERHYAQDFQFPVGEGFMVMALFFVARSVANFSAREALM